MLSFDEAYRLIMTKARPVGSERVALEDAAGRVLAEEVRSDMDMPPFDKSAMDGYACLRADLGQWVEVGEIIPAGRMPTRAVTAGHCAKVMTGAPVPAGTGCVAMREDVEVGADGRVRLPVHSADNLCKQGEDLHNGDVVLRPGTLMGPAHIAVLASVGCVKPLVARRPRVAVIATGAELIEPGRAVTGACIRDSNSRQISVQIATMGGTALRYGIVDDSEAAIADAVARAQAEADVVVLSGGVSEGDFDFVPGALERRGFRLLVTSVAMQPGRPMVFGDDGQRWCLGLPGNPVSTFVVAELFLRPFLLKLMGHDHIWKPLTAHLSEPVRRRRSDRQATLPVAWTAPGQVAPISYHGSAHIDALCRADGFITVPIGVTELSVGSEVHVRPL